METTTLVIPVVERPPAGAALGALVYREDREEHAVKTVLGWVPCRPAAVAADPAPASGGPVAALR